MLALGFVLVPGIVLGFVLVLAFGFALVLALGFVLVLALDFVLDDTSCVLPMPLAPVAVAAAPVDRTGAAP